MHLSILLLVGVSFGVVHSQTIDEVIAQASRGRIPSTARLSTEPIFVDGGRAVLRELDIAVPLPCQAPIRDAPISAADGSINDTTNASPCASPQRRQKRNIADFARSWGTLDIPYTISNQFSQFELDSIDEAFAEYRKYSCVNFIPRTNQQDFFRIVKDGGCWSYIGFINMDGGQPVSLSNGCANGKGVPIHEFFHLIGSLHQQSRRDRNSHITILYENIDSRWHSQFDIASSNLFSTVYSYKSIMHYGRRAFSNNGLDTIVTLDPSKQNVIGNRLTFSFEDLQVLNRYLQCDSSCPNPNPCPSTQYRGKDCNCFCKNDNIDMNNPAVPCSDPNPCTEIGTPCACTAEKCSGFPNTECDSSTAACVCRSGFGLFEGQCVDPATIPCDTAHENCLCSLKPNACSAISQSSCHTPSNECRCNNGFTVMNGMCVAETMCTEPGVPCNCMTNGCTQVANSECNPSTMACECVEDYYLNTAQRMCSMAPACNSLNTDCKCSVQGGDACINIPNSICNTQNDRCECFPDYSPVNGNCEPDCSPSFISDGSQVSPFVNSGGRDFTPNMGDETAESQMFGLKPNGYRLKATGSSSQTAVLLVPRITTDRNFGRIRLCVKFNIKMTDAEFAVQFRFKSWRPWKNRLLQQVGAGEWGLQGDYRIRVKKPHRFSMRLVARVNPESSGTPNWKVLLYNLIIRNCGCGR